MVLSVLCPLRRVNLTRNLLQFWPIVSHADALIKHDDLYSEIVIDRGYFTSGTHTTRQVLALAEGPVIVLDTLTPDSYADGWVGEVLSPPCSIFCSATVVHMRVFALCLRVRDASLSQVAGPSWMVVTGVDSSALHYKRWPMSRQRPNVTAQGPNYADFYGFGDVFDVGADQHAPPVALTEQKFLVVFPQIANDTATKQMGLTVSTVDATCVGTETCPLFPSRYIHQTTQVSAGETVRFITVLWPHAAGDASQMAASVQATIAPSGGESRDGVATVSLKVGGVDVSATMALVNAQVVKTKWRVER